MNELDDKIKNILQNHEKITEKDKMEVWNKIEEQLNLERKEGEVPMKNQKKRSFTGFIAAAAAVAIIFIGSQTDLGHALIDQIKELFVPEKQITQDIEGNKEKTDVNLNVSKESDYIIYIDEERYTFINGEESDKITAKTPLGDKYPEVSMEVTQIIDKSPSEVIKNMEESIRKDYETFFPAQKIDQPIDGWTTRGLAGNQWDSKVIKVYVLSNGKEGSFIITQRYFLEAEEGHGARFDHMVKEFHLVEEK